jgi:flagellar biosynthetic protein FlhB
MAGDEKDKSQQTEDATQHRLEEAFKKGQVPFSKELIHWGVLIMSAFSIFLVLPIIMKNLFGDLKMFITNSHDFDTSLSGVGRIGLFVSNSFMINITLVSIMTILGAVIMTFAQTRFSMSEQAFKLKWSQLSIKKGWARIFSKRALVEFLKSFVKVLVLGWILYEFLKDPMEDTLKNMFMPHFFNDLKSMLKIVYTVLILGLTLLGGSDYYYQRYEHLQSLKMSKQEIKEEYKEMEGSPEIKNRLRQLRMEVAKRRMMTKVPTATAVLMNPTHYAVAILYEPETMSAPLVVAKGQDAVALKIRDVAKENKVPVIRNPELARALYKDVEIDQEIPAEHYRAVAEIIRIVMNAKSQLFNPLT